MSELERWIEERGITEVECLIPDMNGVLRGKVLPAAKLVQSERDRSLRLPSSVFAVTVTGQYAGAEDDDETYQDPDMVLIPDASTLRRRRGVKKTPTAYGLFADALHRDGSPWDFSSPRHVLRAVMDLYHARGWRPVVALEARVLPDRGQSRSRHSADDPSGGPIVGRAESRQPTALWSGIDQRIRGPDRRHL